jgi:hypothetical protein
VNACEWDFGIVKANIETVAAARTAIAEGDAILRRIFDDMARGQPKSVPPRPPRSADAGQPLTDRIAKAIAYARNNRCLAAGATLIKIKEWYEASDPTAFAPDERTWPQFAAKHFVPIGGLARVEELIGHQVYRGGLLVCSICSTEAVAACSCGAPYRHEHPWAAAPIEPETPTPSALERAIAGVKASPEKSNRAIAREIGVSEPTVRRARHHSKTDAGDDAPMTQGA